MKDYDFIVVGSGIAGLYTALLARLQGEVLVLTKASIDECNTKYAQGGIAAAVGRGDSPELHYRDTIAAGAGLCDPEAVRILTQEAPDRITDLIKFGVPFDTLNGEIALTREAAHSVPRILHAGGDATGERIEVTLSNAARRSGIKLLEHCLVSDLLVKDGAVHGVRAFDSRYGVTEEFPGRCVILATGGAAQLFKYNTNPEIATGDGVALAYKAGAEIADMEFVQFHPTALRLPGVAPFLISEAVRGEGGILRNVENGAFMAEYCPQADLAPRDIVARSIVAEMRKTHADRVFLDITHLPPRTIPARFPQIYRFCLDHGLDITKTPVPVAPAAHYVMGGVKTNIWGETNIAGLFACGECACTGVHGANRLASNSLLEVLVFSKRILERAKGQRPSTGSFDKLRTASGQRRGRPAPVTLRSGEAYELEEREPSGNVPPLSLSALQPLMWEKVGILRSRDGLEEAAITLATWERSLGLPTGRPSYELNHMVLVGRLMAEAALLREESRGAHFRFDFPHPSPAWLKHIVFRKGASTG